MRNATNLTVIGYLTSDPELKATSQGLSVVNLTIASTPSQYDKNSGEWTDGQTLFMRAVAWRNFAENIAGELAKGDKVIATGKLVSETYQDKEGKDRTSLRLDLESLGRDLSRPSKQTYSQVPKSQPHWSDINDVVDELDEDSPF